MGSALSSPKQPLVIKSGDTPTDDQKFVPVKNISQPNTSSNLNIKDAPAVVSENKLVEVKAAEAKDASTPVAVKAEIPEKITPEVSLAMLH